jgi:hypothetical protein
LIGLRRGNRQVTVELNKGEARNALARAICFHRLGRLRDRATEAQQYSASGLAIITAATASGTARISAVPSMTSAATGEIIPDPLLAHLAPSGGSTSISPAIIYGMPTPNSLRTDSGGCAFPVRSRLMPHNVLGVSA